MDGMYKVTGAILLVIFIWGYTWVTMKIGLNDIPPFLFSTLRLLIGAIPVFMLLVLLKKPLFPDKRKIGSILVMSTLMSLGYLATLTYGMQFVDSGQSSVLVYTMPIFVTLIAHFTIHERLTPFKITGICLGTVGILLILGPQFLNFNAQTVTGELLIIVSALSWACANVFSKVKFTGAEIINMTAWQLLIGAILLFVISLMTEDVSQTEWTLPAVLSLLFNGIFSTAVTFIAWFWVLTKIEASLASMTLMAVPILGLFFGWMQLHETLTINILAGAFLICVGIFFAAFKKRRKELVKDTLEYQVRHR